MRKYLSIILILLSSAAFAQDSGTRYIENYKDLAIEQMNSSGTPASVILAVAMHESGNGTSKIARYMNNHFGMKGKNSNTKIRSSYKDYDSPEMSYQDFIRMLSSRKQFSSLYDKYSNYDYRNWVLGISRGGYAASKTWASQVLGTIKKYKLYQFDNRPPDYEEPAGYSKPIGPKKVYSSATAKIYKVKKGDTLNAIAEKFGKSVKAIKSKNRLRSNTLQIGQKLKI
ncbi:MAG: glucosaminidase domain-containing protein [Daejeonella sp.]